MRTRSLRIVADRRPFLSTPVFAAAGRAGGLLIPFVIAAVFGATAQTDAFFFAFNVILSLAVLFNPVFITVLMPYLAEKKDDQDQVINLVNGFVLLCLPVVFIAGILMWLVLIPLMAHTSGINQEQLVWMNRYFLGMMPFVLLWVWISGTHSIFHTFRVFWFPALSPIIRSMTVVAFLILFHRSMGLYSIVAGYLVGELLRWLIGIRMLIRRGWWHLKIQWEYVFPQFRSFMKQAGFQILALLAINWIPLVDQWFASWFSDGSISVMSYADRLFKIPYQLFLTGFLHIYLTHWSESYFRESSADFSGRVKGDILKVLIVTIVLSAAAALLARPLTGLFFAMSDLGAVQRRQVADLFAWLILGFPAIALNLLYVRVLLVMKKAHVFCIQAWVRFFLNIALNAVFMRIWGLTGIAVATTFVYVVTTLWLYFYVQRTWESAGREEGP